MSKVDEYTLDEEGNEVVVTLPNEFRVFTDSSPMRVAAPTKEEAESIAKRDGHTLVKPKFGLASRLAPKEDDARHIMVEARAGCGKSTTLIEGLHYVMGGESKMTPSPQQAMVWDEMKKSAGIAKTVAFCAFNKSIAEELKSRVPAGVEALTMHSLGFRAVRRAFPRVDAGERGRWRVMDYTCELLGTDSRVVRKDAKLSLITRAVETLVGFCKMNLTEMTDDALNDLVDYYDIDVEGCKDKVFEIVPKVVEMCKDVGRDNRIDFNDMVWLPVALDLPMQKYDMLLVDESHDLSRVQQELALKSGKRLVFVGDESQSIYAFAGADSQSLPNLRKRLEGTERGLVRIPLNVTRRCGRKIVDEAKKIVPDFAAHETCPEGFVGQAQYPIRKTPEGFENVPWEKTYGPMVKAGDMVLCRTNAPLVSQCFKFLKLGIKANIQGRDVGQGLVTLVKKLCGKEYDGGDKVLKINDFLVKLDDWFHSEIDKEQAKKYPSDTRMLGLQDRMDCLVCFADGAATTRELMQKIDFIFTDDKKAPGIKFSSVHRCKGLESKRVFILQPPNSYQSKKAQAWECTQEDNLRYVAITRAIEELYFVR